MRSRILEAKLGALDMYGSISVQLVAQRSRAQYVKLALLNDICTFNLAVFQSIRTLSVAFKNLAPALQGIGVRFAGTTPASFTDFNFAYVEGAIPAIVVSQVLGP
jgi:hypothetical protein